MPRGGGQLPAQGKPGHATGIRHRATSQLGKVSMARTLGSEILPLSSKNQNAQGASESWES